MTRTPDRRDFLRAGSALGGVALFGRLASASTPALPPDPGRTLVLLQLSGGNDGLDTVVPWADDAYRTARPELGRGKSDVLVLDDYRGLHPALAGLRAHWDEGRVALVEGVGYPGPNRSHFESMDVWHAADLGGRAVDEGWIARLIGARFGAAADPVRVVHLGGGEPPYSLHSNRHPAAVMSTPSQYRWVGNEAEVAQLVEAESEADAGKPSSPLERVRERMRAARSSSLELRRAVAPGRRHPYPDSALAHSLADAASILESGLPTRVISVELGGFDTHGDEVRRREGLLKELDQALSAFVADLGTFEAGRRAVVVAFSEFGRRVFENGSGGTDHGKAGPVFVLGHDVKAGLHGSHPSLEDLDEGDLVHSTDFRSVYAEVARDLFGVPSEAFLSAPIEPLDCV